MKRILLLAVIIYNSHKLSAQFYFGNSISKSTYKVNRVKSLKIFSFESETDSTLTRITNYDTLGNPLSYRTFSKKGIITGIDTFIYDHNNYLIKQINSDGGNRIATSFITNDELGQEIKSETFIDNSLAFHSLKKYDSKNRLVKGSTWNYKNDSIVVKSFYNTEGLKTMTVIFDKNPDSTVILYNYDSNGNILNSYKNAFQSHSESVYTYNIKNNCVRIVTISTLKNETSTKKEEFSYYPNGLTYENLQYNKGKLTGTYKAHYTYY